MTKAEFTKLKVGNKVTDIWYGPGVVTKKTRTSCFVQFGRTYPDSYRYDKAHAYAFLSKGHK